MGKVNVGTIIQERLKLIGADGLCNSEHMCGCAANTLAPCMDGPKLDCAPAKMVRVETMDAELFEESGAGEYYDYGEEGEWYVPLVEGE